MALEELPQILTAKHIADYLSLTRKTVYELFKISPATGGIPSFDVGGSKRVEKSDFVKWMDARKREKMGKWPSSVSGRGKAV